MGCARRSHGPDFRTQRARAGARATVIYQFPVGINFLLLGYGHTEGDVGFDESAPVKDARVRIDAGLLAYARSLDVWGLSGKVLAVLPVAEASGSAKVKGQGRDRDVFGLADPLLRFSVNFFGAPALSLDEFATYRQDLIIGASLQVTAPLGQYNSNKLLNVGTNRWSVKPELGVSKAWGPLTLELIPAITFFTNNNDFFGGRPSSRIPSIPCRGTSSTSSLPPSGPPSTAPTTSAGVPPSMGS